MMPAACVILAVPIQIHTDSSGGLFCWRQWNHDAANNSVCIEPWSTMSLKSAYVPPRLCLSSITRYRTISC
eukprot:3004022-Amphidinium_carterae.1